MGHYSQCFSRVLIRAKRGCSCALGRIFFSSLKLHTPGCCLSTMNGSLKRAVNGVVTGSCRLVIRIGPSTILILNSAGSYLSIVKTGHLRVPVFRVRTNGHYFSRYLPRRAGHHVISIATSIGVYCSRRTHQCLGTTKAPERHACIINSPVTRMLRSGLRRVGTDSVLRHLKLRGNGCVLLSTRHRRGVSARTGFFGLVGTIGTVTRGCSVPVLCSYRPHSGGFVRRHNFQFSPHIVRRRPLNFRSCGRLRVGTFTIMSSSNALPRRDDFFLSINDPVPTMYVHADARHPRTLSGNGFVLTNVAARRILRTISITIRVGQSNTLKLPIPGCISRGISIGIIGLVRDCANIIGGVI